MSMYKNILEVTPENLYALCERIIAIEAETYWLSAEELRVIRIKETEFEIWLYDQPIGSINMIPRNLITTKVGIWIRPLELYSQDINSTGILQVSKKDGHSIMERLIRTIELELSDTRDDQPKRGKNPPGRPTKEINDWARYEVHIKNRPRKEVEKEWIDKYLLTEPENEQSYDLHGLFTNIIRYQPKNQKKRN